MASLPIVNDNQNINERPGMKFKSILSQLWGVMILFMVLFACSVVAAAIGPHALSVGQMDASWFGKAAPWLLGAGIVGSNVRSQIVGGFLPGLSIAYKNLTYIANRIFNVVDGVGPEAKIMLFNPSDWFRDEAQIRAPGSRAGRIRAKMDSVSVSLDEYAMASPVTDEDRNDAAIAGAPPVQPEGNAVELSSDKIDLKKERLIRDLIVATTWADGNNGGEDAAGLWAAGAGNTFLADIKKAIETIHNKTGIKPNKLALDLGTFLSLKEESTILDKIKYVQRGVLTAEILASLLELNEVLVGEAVYSSAKEKKDGTDFTSTKIWEVNATKGMGFVFYAPPVPGLKVPMAGVQARGVYAKAGNVARKIESWRENAEHQDVYEAAEKTDIVVTGANLGYLFKDTLLT